MTSARSMRPLFTGLALLSVSLVASLLLSAQPAFAADRSELNRNYQSAIIAYENIAVAQERNNEDIATMEATIEQTKQSIEHTRDQLSETAVDLYKGTRWNDGLLEYVLGSMSFHDAMMRFDTYERVENHYRDVIGDLSAKEEELNGELDGLEQRKAELEQELEDARVAVQVAEDALRDSLHEDGADFHQVQGNGSNCGATAFIVGVNILLHENRYPDNVAVWNGPGFNGDSTTNLAYRAGVWLKANGLSAQISVEQLSGDIHKAEQLREQLEEGNVVIISSGSGSVFWHADGVSAPLGSYPDGHWIMFYAYKDGVYYANDSAVSKDKGAGCPYTEEDMQQWLDGRTYHFATVLHKL